MEEGAIDRDLKVTQVYYVDDAFELTGLGRYNYLVLTTCCIVCLATASEMFAFPVIVAASACDLQLTTAQKGLLSSIPFAGLLVSYFWGYYADTSGRRKAIIWSTSLGFLFAVLTSLSSKWYFMLIFKVIGSGFSTSSYGITMTYLGENCSPKFRDLFMHIMNCINMATEVMYFTETYFILDLHFQIPLPWLDIIVRPWRLLNMVFAIPLGISAILMWCLYESPAFLAENGQMEKALATLKKIHCLNAGKDSNYPVQKLKRKESDDRFRLSSTSVATMIFPLFQPPLLWRTLQLFFLMLVTMTTNNAFVAWFPIIVNNFFVSFDPEQKGSKVIDFCERIYDNDTQPAFDIHEVVTCNDVITSDTIVSGLAYGAIFAALNLVIAKLGDRRKFILLTSFTIAAASSILINLIHHPWANITFFFGLLGTCLCLGVFGSYFVDFFPISHRAMATSLGMTIGRLGSFTCINLIGAVLNSHCHITFYSWGVYVCIGILVAWFLPPDKKVKNSPLQI